MNSNTPPPTYAQALKQARRVGARHATGDAFLAQTCSVVAVVHAVAPAMLFEGARRKGLDGMALFLLSHSDPDALTGLMFDQCREGDEV